MEPDKHQLRFTPEDSKALARKLYRLIEYENLPSPIVANALIELVKITFDHMLILDFEIGMELAQIFVRKDGAFDSLKEYVDVLIETVEKINAEGRLESLVINKTT